MLIVVFSSIRDCVVAGLGWVVRVSEVDSDGLTVFLVSVGGTALAFKRDW